MTNVPCARKLLMLAAILLVGPQCHAAETGLGAYWPGYRGFLAGVVPSKPGLYFRNDILYYSATIPRVVLNGLPVKDASAEVVADIIEPMYVFPRKLFGANRAFVVTQPFAWGKLQGDIIGTNLTPSGTRVSPGDVVVSPLLLGWHSGKLHYNTNLAIFIPIGNYDITEVVNVSRNYWTLDPQFGITYLDPETGWDLSAAVGYSFSFENAATKYTTGQVFHLDYAFGKVLKNGVKVGVNGYAWLQVTPDSGPGALFGSFESRVLGIGPAVQWRLGENSTLMLRYFNEFWVQNHLQGNELALQLRVTP